MRPFVVRALPLLASAIVVASCGQSQEEKALAHVATRKTPGAVRLINLSSTPVNFKLTVSEHPDVPSMEASKFFYVKPGPVKVEVTDENGNKLAVPEVSVESAGAVSILLTDHNGNGDVIAGELSVLANGKSSIRVVGDKAMESYEAVITMPSGKSVTDKVGLSAGQHEDDAGKFKIEIKDKSGKSVETAEIDGESDKAYTVAVATDTKGALVVKTIVNNPMGKPGKMAPAGANAAGGAPAPTGSGAGK